MKLDDTINNIKNLIAEVSHARYRVDEEMEDLYEEICASNSIIGPNPTFKYFSTRGTLCTQRYIEHYYDDCTDYEIYRGTLKLKDGSIPFLFVHYGDTYYKVYFPDDILFKTPEEIKNFVEENSAKYDAIVENKKAEDKKVEQDKEYQQYLKLKEKFEKE